MNEQLRNVLLANDEEQFKTLIKTCTPAVLNQCDSEGNTLLHLVLIHLTQKEQNPLYYVRHLLSRGADISLKNTNGNTAFHMAVQNGYTFMVDEMLGVSKKAKNRAAKQKNTDQDRTQKTQYLGASKKNALKLLIDPDSTGNIPLSIAAQLKDDQIYKRLLLIEPAPGYTRQQLKTALDFRKNQVGGLKKKTVFAAFLESFCPSASMAELTESFAYSGLVAGASAAVAFGLNMVFSGLSVVGLGLMTYANYKKIKAEKNASQGFEELQERQAFLLNINSRVAKLKSQPSLSDDDKQELELMRNELTKGLIKPKRVSGIEKTAADFVTSKEKRLVALSSMGSFLCSYSGVLGSTGLGLGIAAEVMGTSLTALIISAGPIGIFGALGVGLLVAASLGIYHYRNRKQNYMDFGEQLASRSTLEDTVYATNNNLRNGKDNILGEMINNLITPQPAPAPAALEAKATDVALALAADNTNALTSAPEPSVLEIASPNVKLVAPSPKNGNQKETHNHGPGGICKIEIQAASNQGFMATGLTSNKNPESPTLKSTASLVGA